MKRKSKISPGQLTIFDRVIYGDTAFNDLKKAMVCAMQDFYVKKIFPPKIITADNVYNLNDMKQFWQLYDLHDVYIC